MGREHTLGRGAESLDRGGIESWVEEGLRAVHGASLGQHARAIRGTRRPPEVGRPAGCSYTSFDGAAVHLDVHPNSTGRGVDSAISAEIQAQQTARGLHKGKDEWLANTSHRKGDSPWRAFLFHRSFWLSMARLTPHAADSVSSDHPFCPRSFFTRTDRCAETSSEELGLREGLFADFGRAVFLFTILDGILHRDRRAFYYIRDRIR